MARSHTDVKDGKVRLAVTDHLGDTVGWLTPITKRTLETDDVAELLTAWRNANQRFLLTQFEATVPRTKIWLQERVIADPTRVLFLIEDEIGEPLGHVGVLGLDRSDAELDNMIRGRPGGSGQLMYLAEITVLRWLFIVNHKERVWLRVFTHNWLPISMHLQIGFRITEAMPVRKQSHAGEIHFSVEGTQGDRQAFKLARMELSAAEFERFLSTTDRRRPDAR